MKDWLLLAAFLIVQGAIAARYYIIYTKAPQPKRNISIAIYVIRLLLLSVVSYFIGAMVGVILPCSIPNPSNLCGLGGIILGGFIIGPMASFVIVILVARAWTRNAIKVR